MLKGIETMTHFARHPHRNPILGRVSTPAEAVYIEAGLFPHERKMPDGPDVAMAEFQRVRDRLAARGYDI